MDLLHQVQVGTNTVQIARMMGVNVIGVRSDKSTYFVKSFGALELINYKSVDLKNIGETFDLIFDTVGNLRWGVYNHLLNSNGKFLVAGVQLGELFAKKLW